MGVAGPFFKPHPSNLVRIHSFLSCKNAKIFVLISLRVQNLQNIMGTEVSIHEDLLDLKIQMSVVGPIFEPHPSNLVRIHFFLSCKNAEIFVVIFQVVSNLAKISVSVPSIPWGVIGLAYATQAKYVELGFFSKSSGG